MDNQRWIDSQGETLQLFKACKVYEKLVEINPRKYATELVRMKTELMNVMQETDNEDWFFTVLNKLVLDNDKRNG